MGSRGDPGRRPGGAEALQRQGAAQALRIAAHMLEAGENDIELDRRAFAVRGAPDQGVTLAEVALTRVQAAPAARGLRPRARRVHRFHEPTNLCYPSGAHCCVVEIDRDTGRVDILRYVAVDDCGMVINPLPPKGQIHGGVAQGIAQALFEEVAFGEDGQPVTASLVDYTVPSAADLPHYETDHQVTPTSFNPLGAKGLGESGATAAPQAVVNAVVDAPVAPRRPGRRHAVTPQKVWRPARRRAGPAERERTHVRPAAPPPRLPSRPRARRRLEGDPMRTTSSSASTVSARSPRRRGCCWCTTCAGSAGSPARTSAATPPTAAPAPSCWTG